MLSGEGGGAERRGGGGDWRILAATRSPIDKWFAIVTAAVNDTFSIQLVMVVYILMIGRRDRRW